MITLDENSKRVTWRLDDAVHAKLSRVAKTAGITMEEVANVVIDTVKWDDAKPFVAQYRNEKQKAAERKKRATETVSKLDGDLLDKLANYSPEEIAKLLGNNS